MIALIITHILILIAGISIGISYREYHGIEMDLKQFYKDLKKETKYIWKHRKEIISNE